MAYDREKILEQAKEVSAKNKLIFVDEIPAFLPCSRSTFYHYFPEGSDELDTLKAILENNKIEIKTSMRGKWYKSTAPALQMALMKLISTDDERRALSLSFSEVKTDVTHKLLTLDPLENGGDDDPNDSSAS
jgi:hypothetical protein